MPIYYYRITLLVIFGPSQLTFIFQFLCKDPHKGNETAESSSPSLKGKDSHRKKSEKLEEVVSEKNQNNIVTSLAEKAMSVAGPVVPTREDGEVDQERSEHILYSHANSALFFLALLI